MKKLRDPDGGCPWDLKQNFNSIAPYTIEEAYEVADAIERGHMDDLREELGDLMFQVIFYAQLAEEDGHFTFDEICDGLTEKMVRRHPHVFSRSDGRNAEVQTRAWEDIKAAERAAKQGAEGVSFPSILSDVPLGLPALTRAEKLQNRAARVGFDWPDLSGVMDKIIEEAQELSDAAESLDADAVEDEMGDLLFALTNLSRKLGVDPETALRRTNRKFTQRFNSIERYAHDEDRRLDSLGLDEMEALWQAAKSP
jgi:MazG family protein